MTQALNHLLPASGLKGITKHWRNDLIAATSVALVALPLGLGIAVASDVPPMAGIWSAIIGGLVTTFLRSGHVSINGPTAGLIAVVLIALRDLDDGSGRTLNYIMAAIVVAGALQVILGLFRLGRMAEIFPSAVINGILAAIGVIIIAKQLDDALGVSSDAVGPIDTLMDVISKIPEANPFVLIISLLGILLLIFHSKISYKLFHFLPAPMWVLFLSIPFVYIFDFFRPHEISLSGAFYAVGPELLISIPDNPLESIIHPDFSKIGTGAFWITVISITLIASVETLAASKAIDKLDPYRRKTNLDRDLIGVGVSTMIAGAIGGLPIITVIVRSTVNVHNNAKTRWSNFYHGALLLIFILLLAPVIQKVPLAALAAILVYTGFKLASPRIFADAYEQGMEQLLFLSGTLIITLFSNLLWGIIGGILLTLTVHVLLARLPIPLFFQMVFKPGFRIHKNPDGSIDLKVKGVANFLSMLRLKKLLESISPGSQVHIDFTRARLLDLTVLESLEDFKREQEHVGGHVSATGLESFVASATHPLALKSQHTSMPVLLSPRQQRIRQMALKEGWIYRLEVNWDASSLQNFQFFETRPIEHKENAVEGSYTEQNIRWEISDITFDEGAMMAREVYHTTVQVLHLPYEIPKFILEAEGFFDKIFDRVMEFTGQRDIDFKLFTRFSKKFLLKGEDESAIRSFFSKDLIKFLENHDIYHIESNGHALLIFRYLRLARTEEIERMLVFSKELAEMIRK